MYNSSILNLLIKEFGIANAILFCQMESAKNAILYADCIKSGDGECVEYDFERDWWHKEGEELVKISSI
jgi:hypothetical protein